jgi:hypothetical protein
MITSITKGTIARNEENTKWYDRKGYHMTGETLDIRYTDIDGKESGTVYVVFKGTWTRYGTIRDCGDHYIKANYSSYSRIDKDTLQVTEDVEDK